MHSKWKKEAHSIEKTITEEQNGENEASRQRGGIKWTEK